MTSPANLCVLRYNDGQLAITGSRPATFRQAGDVSSVRLITQIAGEFQRVWAPFGAPSKRKRI